MKRWVGSGVFLALLACATTAPRAQTSPRRAPPQPPMPQQSTQQQPPQKEPPQKEPKLPPVTAPTTGTGAAGSTSGVQAPPDYVIGPEDVLAVLFWRDKDLSADSVVVRPDGKISLPLLNDIDAAGLSPDQLRDRITEAAKQYIEDPTVTVVVKTINSRKVFITGQVMKPGPYPIVGPTTVLQMLALAGGLSEFADSKKIAIMRNEGGKTVSLKFNYNDVVKGKKLQQNILLKPGDTIVVPD